jgi:hypothetical protein
MTASMVATSIGSVPVCRLNDWNNTSFSKLCLTKSDSELAALSQDSDLHPDKKAIAARMRESYSI